MQNWPWIYIIYKYHNLHFWFNVLLMLETQLAVLKVETERYCTLHVWDWNAADAWSGQKAFAHWLIHCSIKDNHQVFQTIYIIQSYIGWKMIPKQEQTWAIFPKLVPSFVGRTQFSTYCAFCCLGLGFWALFPNHCFLGVWILGRMFRFQDSRHM